MSPSIEEQISHFICEEIIHQPERVLASTEPLLSSGLLDSFSLMDISLFVEDNFGVRIDDTELNVDTFDTLEELAVLIRNRMDTAA
ncbi:MAG: hypothetical protein B6I38_08040 [Anaerolineaceae bacterium 4572_5.1]|nr:MAG: hypothetical protein B6I38_08040 [Anaerolineaceae bacterium 4572_5.1]RLD09936.1 MAG: hypothetical protein DRI56_03430 [Chloroflexota bacterium]